MGTHPLVDIDVIEPYRHGTHSKATLLNTMGLSLDSIPHVRAKRYHPKNDFLCHGGLVRLQEFYAPGANGAPDIPVLVLCPAEGSGPWPCIFYTCSAGKIIRGNRMGISKQDLDQIVELGVIWAAVAPRVAPEDPHPAEIEDAYAGLLWVADHADELGIDRDRMMILGKSGGGGIAAATALMSRDRGGPKLTHQILIAPMLDDRELTVSSQFEGVVWDHMSNRTGWTAMLGDARGGPDVSPYAAPSRATDLSGLPPAYIEVGDAEVFRDECIDYAARLAKVGVPIDLHVWAGAMHSSEQVAVDAEVSKATLAVRASYIRRAVRPVCFTSEPILKTETETA